MYNWCVGGTVEQFWSDVRWGDIDFMLVDMPPGTGDVPLTVFQSLPLDGILIVTSPQELVGMIVENNIVDTARLPIDPSIAAACDNGNVESLDNPWLSGIADMLERL